MIIARTDINQSQTSLLMIIMIVILNNCYFNFIISHKTIFSLIWNYIITKLIISKIRQIYF